MTDLEREFVEEAKASDNLEVTTIPGVFMEVEVNEHGYPEKAYVVDRAEAISFFPDGFDVLREGVTGTLYRVLGSIACTDYFEEEGAS